jgi:hypothetical protein
VLKFFDYMIRKITFLLLGIVFAILIGTFMYYYLTDSLNSILQNLINNLK